MWGKCEAVFFFAGASLTFIGSCLVHSGVTRANEVETLVLVSHAIHSIFFLS